MLYRIKNTTWSQCNDRVKKRLRSLTLTEEESQDGSLMRNYLARAETWRSIDPEIFTLQNPIVYNAWAMIYHEYESKVPVVMIYVHPKYRRRGLGSYLLKRVQDKYPEVRCRPWDRRSKMFYVHHNVMTQWNRHPSELAY